MLDGKKKLWAILGAILVIGAIGATLSLLYFWPTILVRIDPSFKDIATLGQYGDSFGALTAIFTAAAFVVLCWTLIAQQEELRLQREEMKKSREIFDEQKKVMALQLFETTLFNLLQQHHQILSGYSLMFPRSPHDNTLIEYKGIQSLRLFINIELLHIKSMETCPVFDYEILVLQNLYSNVCSLIEHVENDAPDFIDKNKYKKIISRELYLEEKGLLCLKCWKLKDDNMKSFFWDYVFGKQELEVMGFRKSLMQEINTYFNPKP